MELGWPTQIFFLNLVNCSLEPDSSKFLLGMLTSISEVLPKIFLAKKKMISVASNQILKFGLSSPPPSYFEIWDLELGVVPTQIFFQNLGYGQIHQNSYWGC